ncbi:hypothetical protein EVAR_102784_1 [Eumeta japonica]|uniref:Uncharacterized protein n=1 Tax=Eumeta variegata TaxID=151549 RepID=A0A4C1TJ55_EUMVA|nr:hypothetical protein EVAR_102784_1 [Eumeta japonica]
MRCSQLEKSSKGTCYKHKSRLHNQYCSVRLVLAGPEGAFPGRASANSRTQIVPSRERNSCDVTRLWLRSRWAAGGGRLACGGWRSSPIRGRNRRSSPPGTGGALWAPAAGGSFYRKSPRGGS